MSLQWLSLVAAIWLQAINGTNSNFPAYSSELKRILSISQLQLNNLASASDAGKLLGWISGLAAAHLPLWLVLLIGSLLGAVGYGVQFLFLTHQIPSLSYWQIFSLTVVAGNSICWINTVCYLVAIKNFRLDRLIAVGLSTSYVGLSAKIYTDIVDVLARTSPSKRAQLFLLLNAVLPLLLCIVASPLARDVNVGKTRKLTRGFLAMFVITAITGVFAVATSLGPVFLGFLPRYAILAGMVAMLLLLLVVPLGEKVGETVQQKCGIRVYDEGFGHAAPDLHDQSSSSMEKELEMVQDEIGPKVMLQRVEFWLYYSVYLFGATLGLVYVNNLAQIAESRGCSGTSSLVSLSSAFSFFGRLLPSLLHFFLPKSKHLISRAGAMGVMMIPMSGAFFLLQSRYDASLYVSTAIIGICTGAIASISVSTTTELFGEKNFGVNHNIVVSNIPIGTFLFGDSAALLYNRGINEVHSGEGNCMGQNCYQITFIIWGCLCVVGTFLAFILHLRTKKLYLRNNTMCRV